METIEKYLNALPSETYIVQLWHKDEDRFRPIRKILKKEEVLAQINFFKAKNCQGYNIYCRPDDYCYILLDDLLREVLENLAKLKPCILMETSPNNYQAFLKLSKMPENREDALLICRTLAETFQADMGAAKPEQVGRMPFFTNRKEKHFKNGKYPFVKLHKAENRTSNYIPEVSRQGRACAIETIISKPQKSKDYDRSKRDFSLVCNAIRQNKSDKEIYDLLMSRSDKIRGCSQKRIDSYIRTTLKNAHRAVKEY